PRQPPLVVDFERRSVALAGAGDRFRRQMVDLLELISARLADADRLAAEPRLEMAGRLPLRDLGAGEPGARGHTIRHRVGDELRPALAPQIVGDLGAVGIRDQPAHLVRPLGDRAVDFAGAIDRVRRAALDPAAMDVTRLDETDADVAGDAADRLAPADPAGD